MKKYFLSAILVVILAFQSVAFAEDSNHLNLPDENQNVVLPLNEKQKEQLQYEKAYLDTIFNIINKHYGSPDGFNEVGEFYIENEPKFQFVAAISKEDARTASFINEVKKAIPANLLTVQKVKYSKNELLAIENEVLQKLKTGYKGFAPKTFSIETDVKEQKVKLFIDQINDQFSKQLTSEYGDLVEVQIGVIINEPAKPRDAEFTEMGGGIKISSGPCSTTATATKDTREFLITAGHCITSVGSTVTQGGVNIGTEHFTAYRDGGTDVGLILLTNTNKYIGNKYYYGDIANAEYDNKYTTTSIALKGQLICKSGYKTGVTCGTVTNTSASVTYGSITLNDMIQAKKDGGGLILGGDSGGIAFNAYRTTELIGIVSGRNVTGDPEGTWGYFTKIGPALSAGGSVTLYTSDTRKAVDPNN